MIFTETDIISAVAELIGADRIGALEDNDRTSVIMNSGKRLLRYRDGTEKLQADIILQGRDSDQEKLINDMWDMIRNLCSNARYIPKTENYVIFSARLGNAPVPYFRNDLGVWYFKAVVHLVYIVQR